MISLEERINYIRLSRTAGIGPVTFDQLIDRYGSATESIKAIESGLNRKKYEIISKFEVEKEIDNVHKIGGEIILKCENRYSGRLKLCNSAPPILTVLGNVDLLNDKVIAVVGSRNASLNAYKWTKDFCSTATKEKFVVVSGLARGVDSVAHSSCHENRTIAVLGGGIDQIYPQENDRLYEKIYSEGGLLVSEFKYGEEPHQSLFPRRNRIIAGLSRGVVVVEASIKSGSLLTAQFAIDNNTDVFAVPSHPHEFRARGTNYLIKQGACLIEDFDDFKENFNCISKISLKPAVLKPKIAKAQTENNSLFEQDIENDIELKILSMLSSVACPIEDIVENLKKHSASDIHAKIVELEIQQKVVRYYDGKISLS